MMEGTSANRAPTDREPGWHPDRINPNLQRYWDGAAWTATRRWVAGQWVDDAAAPAAPTAAPPRPIPGYQQAPAPSYASAAPTRARPAASVSPGLGGLMFCSLLLILGSFTPWLTISLGPSSASVAGTDSAISQLIGVNGWITFSAGILLFILVCMVVISAEPLFRSVALVVALAAAGFAVFDLVRILQKISEAASTSSRIGLTTDNHIGWGLIVVVIGGIGVLLFALSERNA
jgi:hypothetical protein